jgi:L-rhamnose mutarotase
MIRKAFTMKVFPEKTSEYVKRHNPIWKVLEYTLKAYGVGNYSIFLDKNSHMLFGYAEVESEEKWQAIAQTDICREWWLHMAPLMETNEDNSPVTEELAEVFHLR